MPQHSPTDETSAPVSRFGFAKRSVLVVLFILFAAVAWRLWDQHLLTSEGVILAVAKYPVFAPVAFVAIYALAMLFMLPTLPLNLGAGYLWGALAGGLYSLLGSTLGALAAFLFARTAFGQPFARGFNARWLERMAKSLEDGPVKVMAFVRLNPAVPTSVVNFLLGLTSLRFWTYAWGTLVFSAPLCVVFSYLGAATGGFVLDGGTGRLVRIIAVSLGVFLFIAAGRHVLRNRQGAENEQAPEVVEVPRRPSKG